MRSSAHNELQNLIKNRCQGAGRIAIKEHYVGGKKIDVLIQNVETKYAIACEVQLAVKHYKENILRDLQVGCDEVWIISINKKVSERIEKKALKELDKRLLAKVRFMTMTDFIPP